MSRDFSFGTKKPKVDCSLLGFLYVTSNLLGADFKHLGSACRTNSFGGWFAILHGYSLEIGNLFF